MCSYRFVSSSTALGLCLSCVISGAQLQKNPSIDAPACCWLRVSAINFETLNCRGNGHTHCTCGQSSQYPEQVFSVA